MTIYIFEWDGPLGLHSFFASATKKRARIDVQHHMVHGLRDGVLALKVRRNHVGTLY